jgi:3-methyladenine DNA glycosylase AlkD
VISEVGIPSEERSRRTGLQGQTSVEMDVDVVAIDIDRRIRELDEPQTEVIRSVRRSASANLRRWSCREVLALAEALVDRHRWVAYELLYHHPTRLACLNVEDVERLGRGIDGWASVDVFARYISGPAWQQGLIGDHVVQGWTQSENRWWRRAALVSTVALNLRSAGGTGDTDRTLEICTRLVSDRDDMVVKALSWALRELIIWDAGAVRRFLQVNADLVASRVRREVYSKLESGLKNVPRS